MTIDQHPATVLLPEIDVRLKVESGEVSLDENRSPFAQVRIVCALPPSGIRETIDLRDQDLTLDMRLRRDFGSPWSLADLTTLGGGAMTVITQLLDGGPLANLTHRMFIPWNAFGERASQRRHMRLLVTERMFDDVAKTLTLTAQSYEALLRGDALLQENPWNPGTTDLQTICRAVLARYDIPLVSEHTATVAEVDATLWQPGMTADRYLNPLLEAASLRLWCDETGTFHLSERQGTTPGAVVITSTGTMTRHRDTMTRTDPDVWHDGVAVEYRWTDDDGATQVRHDVAGAQPARSVLTLERTTAYPGAGAAAGILNRAQARGRVLDVEAVADYTLHPGQTATINPPDTPAQTGYVSAIEWLLPDAEMRVATRGLVDTPETSWLFAPAGLAWDDIDPSISWLDYDPDLIGA